MGKRISRTVSRLHEKLSGESGNTSGKQNSTLHSANQIADLNTLFSIQCVQTEKIKNNAAPADR